MNARANPNVMNADADAGAGAGAPPRAHRRRGRAAATVLAVAAALLFTGCATRAGWGERSARPEGLPAVSQALAADTRTGAVAVEVRDLEWTDESRQRQVPARLYLPSGAAGAPLVVFSHGLGGSRYGYSHLGRYWASHGIATLHLQHPGSDRAVWSAQGLAILRSLQDAATPANAIARVHDVSFALDRLLADPVLSARVDPARIGVAGHSFGANTSLLSVGARFRDGDAVLSFADPRIRAAVILSAPSLPAGQDPAFAYGAIRVPTLHLTGTQDVTPIPGLSTSASERRIPFDSMGAAPRYLGVFDGGRHSAFSDWSGDPTALAIKASTRAITLAFWRDVFERDAGSAQVLAAPERAMPDTAGTLASWEARR